MQIRTTKVGEYIAKILATKPTLAIYEVEEWGFCSIDVCDRERYFTYFTTLEEAKDHFDNVAELNNYSREYDNSITQIFKIYDNGYMVRKD